MPFRPAQLLLLSAALAGGAPARVASTIPDPALLESASVLYGAALVGGTIRDWCLKRSPADRAVIERGFAAWQAASGVPQLEAYLRATAPDMLPRLRGLAEVRRAQTEAALDADSSSPRDDCRAIQAHLTAYANLARLYPADYQRTVGLRQGVPVAPAPQTAPPVNGDGGPFITGTDFSPFRRPAVLSLLSAAGGQAPFRVGGPLTPGAFQCSRRDTDEDDTLVSEYRYTLNLYGDGGVRAIRATVRNRSGSAYALKDQAGTYTFDRSTGTIRARSDRDSDQLEELIVAPGSYDQLSVNGTIFNFFRAVTDGRGRQMLYGQQAFGAQADTTQTVCTSAGAPVGVSPVQQERRARAEEARIFNLYRVAPAQGLKAAQIEGIAHHFSNRYDGINVTGVETVVLLLKDGRAYFNLRWNPTELNVAASMKGEPKMWGQWRRRGSELEVKRAGSWEALPGTLGVPGGVTEKLSGTYEFFSAYTSGTLMFGATATTRITYAFKPDGTYVLSGGNAVYGNFDTGATQTTGAAVGSDPTRSGTYRFDGYTMELRDRAGTVNRTVAFFWDRSKKHLYLSDRSYTRQ